MPLTNDAIKRLLATATKPLKVSDGRSLNIYLKGGHASWLYVFRDPADGRIRHHGLGGYPQVSIAQARRLRDDFAADLRAGRVKLTPTKSRQALTAEEKQDSDLFEDAADTFLNDPLRNWTDGTRRSHRAIVERYAKPLYGFRVREIKDTDIERVVRPLWDGSGTSRGVKLRQLLEGVFRSKRVVPNPASLGVQPNLIRKKEMEPEHFASMPASEVPAFMRTLGDSVEDRALRFIVLTGGRRMEALAATWKEFDFKAGAWVIPAERMRKSGREQVVPLTAEMLAVVGAPGEAHALVFPGRRTGRKLGNEALTVRGFVPGTHGRKKIYRIPRPYVPHGFRSTLATWAEEQRTPDGGELYGTRLIDAVLSHGKKDADGEFNKVTGAYQRSKLIEQRRPMMAHWSKYATGATAL